MKAIKLRTRASAVICVLCSVVLLLAALAWLWLDFSLPALAACVFGALLLGLYDYIVFNSTAIYHGKTHMLSISGLDKRELCLCSASKISTRENPTKGSGRSVTVLDKEGLELYLIPVFSGGKGYGAELIARELAAATGLAHTPAVPEYLYDRSAAKARKKALHHGASETEADTEPGDINYDLMDDD